MNDSRRPDPRRDASQELAELLAGDDGARAARLLQSAGFLRTTERAPVAEPAPPDPGRPVAISIWRPEERDGELFFVRPDPSPLGDHYAARLEIPARKADGVPRIAFFGESVAAGYLYAPHLTPARVLEQQLRCDEGPRYEVIDLARTNETLDALATTVAASLQLDPDVLVIFAGNNWNLLETPEVSPWFPSVRGRQRYALALRRDLQGPAELARRRLVEKAERILAAIARLAGERPVVVVVPEVDLADWHEKQPVPWLAGDDTARWYELYDRARSELAAEKYREAAGTAAEMAALDGGLCPTSELLRARALIGLGDADGARRAFEAQVARSSYATAAFLGSPRASVEVQDLLRKAAERHGFRCVDLPEVFAHHTGSPLPGRRLFLDYCHLTREGIEVAMAAVAGAILLPPLKKGGPRGDFREGGGAPGSGLLLPPLKKGEPRADFRAGWEGPAEAVAWLGAAIHGAHRLAAIGDKGPWIEHRLRRALDADPGIAQAMLDLAHARCAPCPPVLTPAQGRALASPHRLLLQHGWRWDHLDADLLRAVVAVLEERGHTARKPIHRALLEHHGLSRSSRDLARPPYLWDPVERFYPEAMDPSERAFFRAAWPESSFCLIADGHRHVELDVTLRLPAIASIPAPRTGEVRVLVDGRELGRVAAGEGWQRHSLGIPGDQLGAILHRLTLRWPALPAAGDLALANARRRLELGIEAEIHPIFGEVFSLVARAADPASR